MDEHPPVVVMKFGGTSVADAEAIRRVVRHVQAALAPKSRSRRPVVVVSALAGVTDRLLSLASAAERGDRRTVESAIEALRTRHVDVGASVASLSASELAAELDTGFVTLRGLACAVLTLGHASPRVLDSIAGLGELLSSRIVHAALLDAGVPAAWVDARRVIVTDDHFTAAAPLTSVTEIAVARELGPLLAEGLVPVMGGYLAATADGIMTTLGRGGSDYSAAIVGAALEASEIQIWTDVDGMMTADPRLVPAAQVVPRLTFTEASELAHFGAKVLHPRTIAPAVAKGIPVRILNSRCLEKHGTVIASTRQGRTRVAAITCKRDVSLLTLTFTRAASPHGVLRQLFEAFERHRAGIDLVTISETGVSVTVQDRRNLDEIAQDLAGLADVHVEQAMAIVCAVGDRLCAEPRLAARMLAALDMLPVHMVSQTASRRGLALIVREADADIALKRLHAEIFERTERSQTSRPMSPIRRNRSAATAVALEVQP